MLGKQWALPHESLLSVTPPHVRLHMVLLFVFVVQGPCAFEICIMHELHACFLDAGVLDANRCGHIRLVLLIYLSFIQVC